MPVLEHDPGLSSFYGQSVWLPSPRKQNVQNRQMIKSTVQEKGLETLQVPTSLKQKHVSPSIPFSVTTNVTNCHCFTKQLKNNLEEGTKIINLILSISQYFFCLFVMVFHCILLHGQNALED